MNPITDVRITKMQCVCIYIGIYIQIQYAHVYIHYIYTHNDILCKKDEIIQFVATWLDNFQLSF